MFDLLEFITFIIWEFVKKLHKHGIKIFESFFVSSVNNLYY